MAVILRSRATKNLIGGFIDDLASNVAQIEPSPTAQDGNSIKGALLKRNQQRPT